MAGYSGTPLIQKLGIKNNFKMAAVNPPTHYWGLLGPLPEGVKTLKSPAAGMDFIHFFPKSRSDYEKSLLAFKATLVPSGMIWVSWPKAASKVPTDLSENLIRNFALKNGLVDIKVCAVDETWSGLKLVIPVKDRKK
jgi:hypothetical protein